MDNPRPKRKRVNPDKLQQRVLGLISQFVESAEKNPGLFLGAKNSVKGMLDISEHLRKLNADLNNSLDIRSLQRLSDADLEKLEKRAREGK